MSKSKLKKEEKKENLTQTLVNLTAEQRRDKKKLFAQPVQQCDLEKVNSVADLVDAYAGMSIQARNIGGCLGVLESMYADKGRPTVFLGLAGPLVAGGLRKVIRDMIEYKLVDVVVSTGAILYQDLYQARGFQHYRGSPLADDGVLHDLYIDRIYDTYVDEEAFLKTDSWVGRFADTLAPGRYSSRAFLRQLAQIAKEDQNSILGACWRHGVPVFSPAINDSSIGIGLTDHYHRCKQEGREGLYIDSIRDNYELTQIVIKSKKTAAIYIAGGVPKNYINDSIIMSYIFGENKSHSYAIQLTTDVPHWGGLSGSTLDEAKSWGKINVKATSQMAFVEPTVALPLLTGAVLQKKLTEQRPRLAFEWDGDILKDLKSKKG